jgi:hypothetical protein
LEDSRDVYEKKFVGQEGWYGMKCWNFFEDYRKVRIMMEGEVGDIPGSVKDSMKDFIP